MTLGSGTGDFEIGRKRKRTSQWEEGRERELVAGREGGRERGRERDMGSRIRSFLQKKTERRGWGGIGTGTARAVHAQPPGRAHPVCIRALPTSQEEPAKSRLTRHCATCLATVVIILRYTIVVSYIFLHPRYIIFHSRHRHNDKTNDLRQRFAQRREVDSGEFETGRYSIYFSKVDRDNRNGNCRVTAVVV